jgi:GT2 family glycosyltransferase
MKMNVPSDASPGNPAEPPPDLSIIIINYNTADLVLRCLSSIETQEGVAGEIFVVDNASTDGSPHMIASRFKSVHLIANSQNVGFSRANNQALQTASGRYILFLNPDTEVKPEALENAIRYMERNQKMGLAGFRLINPDGSPQQSLEHRYPGHRHAAGELTDLPGDIAWVPGAAMIARRQLVEQTQGFDERYFLYAEDVDLCISARKIGWEIGFIEDAVAVHWGGQSERGTTSASLWRKKFSAELIFYTKHYSPKTLQSIARSNLIQAYWRIATLKLTLPFVLNKPIAESKLAKYKVAVETFRHLNDQNKGGLREHE